MLYPAVFLIYNGYTTHRDKGPETPTVCVTIVTAVIPKQDLSVFPVQELQTLTHLLVVLVRAFSVLNTHVLNIYVFDTYL